MLVGFMEGWEWKACGPQRLNMPFPSCPRGRGVREEAWVLTLCALEERENVPRECASDDGGL